MQALHAQVEHLWIERELREQAARGAERSAIAAEMHDVLAHRLSLIALHTGVLATRRDTPPAPVVERLTLLRTASTAPSPTCATCWRTTDERLVTDRPAPVLRDVEEMIEEARAGGRSSTQAWRAGPSRPPPPIGWPPSAWPRKH
ncbi:histidine kinase dimerization/phosphoacceptor domain-containing protein [Streptomyces lateritius]|uniref:histidine kinase dimerization/phosphoacceptor domain-containing protein n=1 Tax=Streptomyces lateritius TaxID=67313 RepID=UPI0021AB7A76|nr:histidine kinase dimerization/phosphoacceptor domain-containing protein [Streptomyces lateritius]